MRVDEDTSCRKHPKCMGVWYHGIDGSEFDCEYKTTINCENCAYGGNGGRLHPDAKRNQINSRFSRRVTQHDSITEQEQT